MRSAFGRNLEAAVKVAHRALMRPSMALRTLRAEVLANGLQGAWALWHDHLALRKNLLQYTDWVNQNDTLNDSDRDGIRLRVDEFPLKPLISIVVPVYNPPLHFLEVAVQSVKRQLYPHWELCLADDASTDSEVRSVLRELADSDKRIKVAFRDKNGHISAASNSALELAGGDFVALLDQDDELPEHALYCVADLINQRPNVDIIFSDEDKIDERGRRYEPHFKPGWNKGYMLSVNLISHLGVYRRELIQRIGGFRTGYEGAQDYDLALRCLNQSDVSRVCHIPQVLYHWRSIPTSTASSMDAKSYVTRAAIKALTDFYSANNANAEVFVGEAVSLFYAINQSTPQPSVTLIISSEMPSDWEDVVTAYGEQKVQTITFDPCDAGPLRMQNAAKLATGDVLLFVEKGIAPAPGLSLNDMVGQAMQPDVGIVGAKILDSKGRIAHGGYVMTPQSPWADPLRGCSQNFLGPFGWAVSVRDVSAVSGKCMAMRKSVWEQLHGFDIALFPEVLADVDLCLRAESAGYRVVWTPRSIVVDGNPNALRNNAPPSEEWDPFQQRWDKTISSDPHFSPHLSPAGFRIVMDPKVIGPWKAESTTS